MPSEIVVVGYTCPLCGRPVTVLNSSQPPAMDVREFVSFCKCGFVRNVKLTQLQELEVWRIRAAN